MFLCTVGEKKSAAIGLIVDTIDKLHSHDLVHGDLRGSNILLYGMYKKICGRQRTLLIQRFAVQVLIMLP